MVESVVGVVVVVVVVMGFLEVMRWSGAGWCGGRRRGS
jgi:hypothetical protein